MNNSMWESRGRLLDGLKKKTFAFPKDRAFQNTIERLSSGERFMFWAIVAIFVASAAFVVQGLNKQLLTSVPAHGGTHEEGIVGAPRFANPLLALSDADRDLTELVYSGLLKPTTDGKLIEDLAESYTAAEDGLSYQFKIRDDAVFQDGKPVTADDVIFTITQAQNPALKSPRRANWEGVHVSKVSDKEVLFTLPHPYSPFLENATIGILPKHIWEKVSADEFPFTNFNIEPLGSGPYKIDKIQRNSTGLVESYALTPFRRYTLGEPFIEKFVLRFYPNEADLVSAYKSGEVDAIHSISPKSVASVVDKGSSVVHAPLPRIFAVFFNQNQATIFTRKEVRTALDMALDKNLIVKEVLGGYGTALSSPFPPGVLATPAEATSSVEEAKTLLEKGGWTFDAEKKVWTRNSGKDELSFSLATPDTPELAEVAQMMKEQWEKLGAKVEVKMFTQNDLNQNVLRPRKYDALLFGEIVGRELDLFAFWHSSQRNDPGLNIAMYANITADKLLASARSAQTTRERTEAYEKFATEVKNDVPAVFTYSPDFIYIVPKRLRGLELGSIAGAQERFLNVNEWYVETDTVWDFFAR